MLGLVDIEIDLGAPPGVVRAELLEALEKTAASRRRADRFAVREVDGRLVCRAIADRRGLLKAASASALVLVGARLYFGALPQCGELGERGFALIAVIAVAWILSVVVILGATRWSLRRTTRRTASKLRRRAMTRLPAASLHRR